MARLTEFEREHLEGANLINKAAEANRAVEKQDAANAAQRHPYPQVPRVPPSMLEKCETQAKSMTVGEMLEREEGMLKSRLDDLRFKRERATALGLNDVPVHELHFLIQ